MSGFLRTVSTLGQNFFACLPAIAGREALAVLQKSGGAPSRRVVVESLVACLPAGTKGKGPAIIPWGVGRVTERGILLSKTAYFVCRTAFVSHAL